MKKLFFLTLLAVILTGMNSWAQQDKSKRPSPPAKASSTLSSGAVVSIDYSQPSVKGRTLATLAPLGKVWRTGANEATVFETSKDLKIQGQTLPAGKYGLYTIPGEKDWTVIFNKKWNQWGTVYSEADDQIRVTGKASKADFAEKMTFTIQKNGKVSLNWADTQVDFKVQ